MASVVSKRAGADGFVCGRSGSVLLLLIKARRRPLQNLPSSSSISFSIFTILISPSFIAPFRTILRPLVMGELQSGTSLRAVVAFRACLLTFFCSETYHRIHQA
jgi:hypothetical protein